MSCGSRRYDRARVAGGKGFSPHPGWGTRAVARHDMLPGDPWLAAELEQLAGERPAADRSLRAGARTVAELAVGGDEPERGAASREAPPPRARSSRRRSPYPSRRARRADRRPGPPAPGRRRRATARTPSTAAHCARRSTSSSAEDVRPGRAPNVRRVHEDDGRGGRAAQGRSSYAGSVRNSTKSGSSATCWKSSAAGRYAPRACAARRPRPRSTCASLDAAVPDPLPDLRAGDLGGGGVLHQVVDRRRAGPGEPGADVLDADRDVQSHAVVRHVARRRGDVQQLRGGDRHVVALPRELVGPVAEHAVELGPAPSGRGQGARPRCRRSRRRPRAACPRVTFSSATALISGSRRERDERGHAADRVRAAPVARLHEELRVRAHERHRHRHQRPVGKDELGPVAELLDHAEHVVPAARVQPGRVLAQLVEDLLHLERRQDRLDQDGRADRPARQRRAAPARATKTSFQSRASRWLSSFGR